MNECVGYWAGLDERFAGVCTFWGVGAVCARELDEKIYCTFSGTFRSPGDRASISTRARNCGGAPNKRGDHAAGGDIHGVIHESRGCTRYQYERVIARARLRL